MQIKTRNFAKQARLSASCQPLHRSPLPSGQPPTNGVAGETATKLRRRALLNPSLGSATPGGCVIKWHAEGVLHPVRVDPRFQRESWWSGYPGVADPQAPGDLAPSAQKKRSQNYAEGVALTLSLGSATPGGCVIKWHAEGVLHPVRVDPRFQRESWWSGYPGVADPQAPGDLAPSAQDMVPGPGFETVAGASSYAEASA